MNGLVELKDVEIAQFPCIDQRGKTWPVETADLLLATFAEYGGKEIKPPLVLGHDEQHPLMKASGLPSLGWGVTLAKKVVDGGVKVLATVAGVPALVADLIGKGAYRRISSAWWDTAEKAGLKPGDLRPVLKHIGLLGADTPRLKSLQDVQALYEGQETPQAAFADENEANIAVAALGVQPGPWTGVAPEAAPSPHEANQTQVTAAKSAEMQDSPAAAPPPPATVQEAVQRQEPTKLRALLNAISERTWVIKEEAGQREADMIQAIRELQTQISEVLAGILAAPAATMTDANPAAPAAAAPAPAAPSQSPVPSPQSPVAAMSDDVRQSVEVYLTRKTAAGKMVPAEHPAVRAEAAALFAHGGAEAVVAWVGLDDRRRKEILVPMGEVGVASHNSPARSRAESDPAASGAANCDGKVAEFADVDPAVLEAARREYADHVRGRAPLTEDQYVRARLKK